MQENQKKRVSLYDDGIGFIELVDFVGSDLSVVNSARVSFGKHKEELDSRDEKLIRYLINHRHTSTLEHCFVTFRVKVPLFVRSQHHRHRTWSYNEISRRYTDFDICFYEPKAFRTQHKSNRQASNAEELINPKVSFMWDESITGYDAALAMKEIHEGALYLFESMIEAGVCREQARGVLPQNMYTEYYASCNMSNLLKFIDLRTHEGAQWEIQQLANGMLDIVSELYPVTVRAYKERNEEF
jgi:thymidylate synthase (FAD)